AVSPAQVPGWAAEHLTPRLISGLHEPHKFIMSDWPRHDSTSGGAAVRRTTATGYAIMVAVTLQNWLGCSRHWGRNAGGDIDDDCAASSRGATLRAFLRGGGETTPDRGGDDLVSLMSCSAACSVAMFWAICSCLAASCSMLSRIAARSRATSSRANSGDIAAAASVGAA